MNQCVINAWTCVGGGQRNLRTRLLGDDVRNKIIEKWQCCQKGTQQQRQL